MIKFPSLRGVSLLLVMLHAACATNETADFARNELLYVDVPFVTRSRGDQPLLVLPTVDLRDRTPLPTESHGFPIVYGGDDFWERPVPEMISDVLVRQLQSSGIFATVSQEATPGALVLRPTLESFMTGANVAIYGSRSFAEVGLRLQVLGPADSQGKRAVLHDQLYGNRQLSQLEINPVSPFRLIGRALQISMGKALAGLDRSNVGRSSVPLDIGVPAEATAPLTTTATTTPATPAPTAPAPTTPVRDN
ncbi:MAG TPA: hypothetical protein VFT55_01890 [Planctomycetota bacterium]|nr:hypothetical protein [Planctomycetota bacterium]